MAHRERDQPDDSENIFRILVATDNHIGYLERDSIRGNDALVTFEEILQIATDKEVDFLLLGGDLFHDNKPSRKSMHGVLALLRKYCMGQRPCQVEFLSDQAENFAGPFPTVNYESADHNVALPVFAIHGNHDDPTGENALSAMDLLSVTGLLNYFGKVSSVDDITVSPLLMRKGRTRLALYGLGGIRDERLHRTFLNQKVRMLRPRENTEDWFSLFVLHQNRVRHGPTNYIPEQFLANFLDLVIWGHEHECLIEPVMHSTNNFFLTQPGSSVATSLSEGEAKQKHVALLEVRGKQFNLHKIPLQTVRPFIMDELILGKTALDPNRDEQVQAYLAEKVDSMIEKAERDQEQRHRPAMKPLIRLRVEYSGGFTTMSSQRFGQQFVDRVANPRDILQFFRKRQSYAGKKEEDGEMNEELPQFSVDQLDSSRVEDLVSDFLTDSGQMNILSSKALGLAVKEFVDKEERDAISEFVKFSLNQTQSYLKQRNASETNYLQLIQHRQEQMRRHDEDEAEAQEALRRVEEKRASQPRQEDDDEDSDASSGDEAPVPTSRGGRGGRGSRARGRPRGQSTSTRGSSRGTSRGRGRGRGRGAAANKDTIDVERLDTSFSRATSSRASSSYKRKPIVISDSDGELDDIPDDEFLISTRQYTPAASSSRNTLTIGSSSRRRTAVKYEDDDDSDPFSLPEPRSKRAKH